MAGRKFSFLVVDDNYELRDSLEMLLTQLDCSVVTAEDGYKAIEKSRERKFDVILLDIKMPGMDGIETAVRIRKERPDSFILLMTAFSIEQLAEKALSAGVDGVVIKPFDVRGLLSYLSGRKEIAFYHAMLKTFWNHLDRSLGENRCRFLFEGVLKSGISRTEGATLLERTGDGIFVNRFGRSDGSGDKLGERFTKLLRELLETASEALKEGD